MSNFKLIIFGCDLPGATSTTAPAICCAVLIGWEYPNVPFGNVISALSGQAEYNTHSLSH